MILTSKGLAFDDDIISINFENEKRKLTFLKDHAPDVGLIKKSNWLIVEKDNKQTTLFHCDGAFSFIDNVLNFIVDNCDEKELNIHTNNFSDN